MTSKVREKKLNPVLFVGETAERSFFLFVAICFSQIFHILRISSRLFCCIFPYDAYKVQIFAEKWQLNEF